MVGKLVLVDTSIWVEFFLGKNEAVRGVTPLMEADRIAICGAVLQEVLQGARDARAFETLKTRLALWHHEAEQLEDFIRAAEMYARLRWRGLTVPPSDCLIAALAQRCDMMIYAHDKDFERIPRLNLYFPP